MKSFISTYLIFLLPLMIFCQVRPTVPFKKVKLIGDNTDDTLKYIWYETDSVPEWDSEYYTAYNKVGNTIHNLFTDSFVFRINNKYEHFRNSFFIGPLQNGIHITKRNLISGKLIWQVHYSDLEAGNLEMKMNARLNEKGNIEIIGYRKATPKEDANHQTGFFGINDSNLRLFYREYDGESGNLIHHHYPDLNDSDAAILAEYNTNQISRLYFTPNDTTIRYFAVITTPGNLQGFYTQLLTKNGKLIGKIDTIITSVAQKITVCQIDNEYLIIENNPWDKKVVWHYYDKNMVHLRSLVKTNFPLSNFIVLPQQNSDFIEILSSSNQYPPNFFWRDNYYFFDREGELQDSIKRIESGTTFKILENGDIFGHQLAWDTTEYYNYNVFFFKKKGEDIREIKIYKSENNYLLSGIDFDLIGNKLILSCFDRYVGDINYRASTTIAVNLEYIGFPLATHEQSLKEPTMRVYPNPTNSHFTLHFDEQMDLKIEVYNHLGTFMFNEHLSGSNIYFIRSDYWVPGIYIIRFVDHEGRSMSKKIIKI